jgi:hypothetical protein
LVLSWFAGDAFKTVFFLTRGAPIQFTLCGIIQLLVDLCITYQMWIYPSDIDPAPHLQSFRSKRPFRLSDSSL